MPRINKTYTPTELQAAIAVLQLVEGLSEESAANMLKRLHAHGWRAVYAGKVYGERTVRQPKGY
jgi:hypothetical protein